MTATATIIRDAFRENNLLAVGAAPNNLQKEEALRELRRIVRAVVGTVVGDQLFDWPVGNLNVQTTGIGWNEELWSKAVANVRLIVNAPNAQTVTLPPDPDDGARIAVVDPENRLAAAPLTLHGNGRAIVNSPEIVLNVNGTALELFYRADLGKWVELLPLSGDDNEEFPFPEEFDTYFITRLAMRLNSRYGRETTNDSAAAMVLSERNLRARYHQMPRIPCDIGVLFTSEQSYDVNYIPRIARGRIGWE